MGGEGGGREFLEFSDDVSTSRVGNSLVRGEMSPFIFRIREYVYGPS